VEKGIHFKLNIILKLGFGNLDQLFEVDGLLIYFKYLKSKLAHFFY